MLPAPSTAKPAFPGEMDMTKSAADPGHEENPTTTVQPYIGTLMPSKQGPLLLPNPRDKIFADLKGNKIINAELDRLLSREESGADRDDGTAI
jgi:hypothetical protein